MTARRASEGRGLPSIVLLGLSLAACFSNPGVFVWVENATDSDVLIRYEQSAGARVFRIGAGRTGYVGAFPAPEVGGRITILTPDCVARGAPLDVPEVGGVVIAIPVDDAPLARATTVPEELVVAFEETTDCVP